MAKALEEIRRLLKTGEEYIDAAGDLARKCGDKSGENDCEKLIKHSKEVREKFESKGK